MNRATFGDLLKRKVKRLKAQDKTNNAKYNRNEKNFTFHGGFNSGYVKGKLAAYEDIADELGIDIDGE